MKVKKNLTYNQHFYLLKFLKVLLPLVFLGGLLFISVTALYENHDTGFYKYHAKGWTNSYWVADSTWTVENTKSGTGAKLIFSFRMFAFMLHQGTLLFLHRFFHHKDGQWSLDKFSKQGGVGYDALYSVLLILSLLLTVLILITTYAHPHRKKKGGRGLKIIGLILFFFYLLITGFVIGAIIYGNIVADKSYSSKKIAFPFPKENNISLGEKVISLWMIICLVRWVLNFFIWIFFAHYCAIYSRIDAREYNPNINISEVQDRALKSRLQKADQVLLQSNLDRGTRPVTRNTSS